MTRETIVCRATLGAVALVALLAGAPQAQLEPDDIYWHDMGIPGPPFGMVTELSTLAGDLWAAGRIGAYHDGGSWYSVSTIARWNGSEWILMGDGIDGDVHVLYEYNGEIYAGGNFSRISGVAANCIARWDGSDWLPLAGGITDLYNTSVGVVTLLAYDGMLVVGGDFNEVDGTAIRDLAAWDGTAWHSRQIYQMPFSNRVKALTLYEGDLVAAGWFEESSGGKDFHSVARYDPDPLVGWQPMGNPGGATSALAVYNGTLIAGGSYNDADEGVIYWTGTSWVQLGWQLDGRGNGVIDFVEYGGNLVMSSDGWLTLPGDPPDVLSPPVVGWDGEWFGPVGTIVGGDPGFLAVYNGTLLSSGGLRLVPEPFGGVIAQWTGSQWLPLGPGMEGSFNALKTVAWGWEGPIRLYAAGNFHYHDDLTDTRDIIEWDGSSWNGLGTGTDGQIQAMASLYSPRSANYLFVGGTFSTIDGVSANNIASWNQSSWEALDDGINGTVTSLYTGPGIYVNVVAGGSFTSAGGVPCNNIAWWHSGAWHPLGTGLDGEVTAMASNSEDLIVVGEFTTAGGILSPNIARWDGVEWHAMEPPVHPNLSLQVTTVIPTYGRLPFEGGFLIGPTSVDVDFSEWPPAVIFGLTATDGESWCVRTDFRSGYRKEFLRWYGCELIGWARPNTASDPPKVSEGAEQLLSSGFLQRWDGEAWHDMGSGIGDLLGDMVEFGGELIVAGGFNMAGGQFANGLAMWNRPESDPDGDGNFHGCDNCVHDYDPYMTDTDADGAGDACDQCPGMDLCDNDFDGVPGGCDNCPAQANADQSDSDSDLIGDTCDSCPDYYNPEQGCCCHRVGDANGQGDDEPTISDISVMIDAKFITGTCDGIITCLAEADVNQSGGGDPQPEDITISDISMLIDYLFITGSSLGLAECL